jgi:diguanylate cyclase (GGDEF)-like protein
MAVWHFGKPEIPPAGLVLAFAALAVPVAGTFWFPEEARQYEALLWLLALVPAFLLAYYRGWMGVAIAMLIGMIALSGVQIAAGLLGFRADWAMFLAIIIAYIALGLSIGIVSELLHRERARAERLALLDELTGIPNRRLADLFLDKEFAAAQRGRSLAVVLFDIDGFKAYNDRHGHAAGDAALRCFVSILTGYTRRMDLCARYGGEEFVAILSGGHTEGAMIFASRVREALAARIADPEAHQAEAVPPFTVSAGVAQHTPGMKEPADLLALADRALYRAKAEGRDTVRAQTPDPEPIPT